MKNAFKGMPEKIQARILTAWENEPRNAENRIMKYISKFPKTTSFRSLTIYFLINNPTAKAPAKAASKPAKARK